MKFCTEAGQFWPRWLYLYWQINQTRAPSPTLTASGTACSHTGKLSFSQNQVTSSITAYCEKSPAPKHALALPGTVGTGQNCANKHTNSYTVQMLRCQWLDPCPDPFQFVTAVVAAVTYSAVYVLRWFSREVARVLLCTHKDLQNAAPFCGGLMINKRAIGKL